jgi:hypothetical protein
VPPPLNVGVAPTTEPPLLAIVKLWGSEEAFVNLTVTLPALAVSDEFANLRAPLGSAASEIVLAPPPAGAADVDEDEVEVAGLAADDALLLLDPPHAATPMASVTTLIAITTNRCTVWVLLSGLGWARVNWSGSEPGSEPKDVCGSHSLPQEAGVVTLIASSVNQNFITNLLDPETR